MRFHRTYNVAVQHSDLLSHFGIFIKILISSKRQNKTEITCLEIHTLKNTQNISHPRITWYKTLHSVKPLSFHVTLRCLLGEDCCNISQSIVLLNQQLPFFFSLTVTTEAKQKRLIFLFKMTLLGMWNPGNLNPRVWNWQACAAMPLTAYALMTKGE